MREDSGLSLTPRRFVLKFSCSEDGFAYGTPQEGNPINGWVILDKPVGMTSTQAVGNVRRLFDAQKAGHAGTLDPLATGMLPIALGEATKTVPYAVDGTKAYRFTVRWGAGPIPTMPKARSSRPATCAPARGGSRRCCRQFIGEILQTPPAFSAHQDRRRARLRSGAQRRGRPAPGAAGPHRPASSWSRCRTPIPRCSRPQCGKGTYVRALARDMGRQLGCFGHVIALRRTRVGTFESRVQQP